MCKKTPSDVSLCRGSSVICFGAKATDKKSSPHAPSQVTVLTSLWSAGTSACVSGQWTGSGNWSGLNKLHRDQFLGSGLLLNCKNEQQGKGRVKIMICIVYNYYNYWAVWGNRKALNTDRFAEEKVLASVVERIRLCGVVHPDRTSRWEERFRSRTTKAEDSFNSFTTVIDFSVGPQGWMSLIWMGTTLFLSPLFIGDVMSTGCIWGRLCLWWT